MKSKIVVKIGTNVITKDDGLLNMAVLKQIVEQVCTLHDQGYSIIIVSSGAMGAGRALIDIDEKESPIIKRQVLASIGQIKLIHTYLSIFQKNDKICAQVLATKDDFRSRMHYLNIKNCFEGLLQNKIIPIVNENDVISINELMFTDNDELAGLIASMMDLDQLIILTSVDGIYDKHPDNKDAKIISYVSKTQNIENYISPETSSFGRGGMKTKANIAGKLANMGIETIIANGQNPNSLLKIINGEKIGTRFQKNKPKKTSSMKRWIAHSEGYEKGAAHINKNAEPIIKEKIASLLPVGITKIEGEFEKGDIIKIINADGKTIGLGVASYSSKTAKTYIGEKGKKALIHYDHLVLNP